MRTAQLAQVAVHLLRVGAVEIGHLPEPEGAQLLPDAPADAAVLQ